MRVRTVHDRAWLAATLGRTPTLRAYELGDLDDFYWPYTTWYRLDDSVVLLYHGTGLPVLLALDQPDRSDQLRTLLTGLLPLLPRRFEAHLSPGLEVVLAPGFRADPREPEPHLKMALTDITALDAARSDPAIPPADVLTPDDLPQLSALYDLAYPNNAFDQRMLETGQYVGIRRAGELLAVAGVHVWSPTHRVCAVGNVTTRPDARGQGLGAAVVTALCQRIRRDVDHITLNVKADNRAARALYARLGFSTVAEYTEAFFTAHGTR